MNTTKTQAYNDAVSTYYKAAQVLANAVARAKVEAGNAWHSAGGCSRCGGRGWIVTWDTLDSLSGCYAEYGSCDNAECTPETRKASGLNPGYWRIDYSQVDEGNPNIWQLGIHFNDSPSNPSGWDFYAKTDGSYLGYMDS